MDLQGIVEEIQKRLPSVTSAVIEQAVIESDIAPDLYTAAHIAAVEKKLGAAIHGGGIVPAVTNKPTKTKGKAGKLAKPNTAIAPVDQKPTELAAPLASVTGQTVEAVEVADRQMASEFEGDALALAQMMTPELRTMMIVQKAQGLSSQISTALNAQGVTVDNIIAAALPKATQRRSMAVMVDEAVSAIDINQVVADALVG